MAMMVGGGGGRRRRSGRARQADINVTPLVDVMLVLLVVFMITAPLLTTGVDVALPRAPAEPLPAAQEQPLSITLRTDGKVFIQDTETTREELVPKLRAITGEGYEGRIYFRSDGQVTVEDMLLVMTSLQRAGYANVALVTDPKINQGGAGAP